MATITSPAASVSAVSCGSVPQSHKFYLVSNDIDLKAIGAVTADVVQCLPVPAGTFVTKVMVEILRAAAGTSAAATVGDGDDADGWDTAVDLKGTAGTVTYPGLVLTEGTPNVIVDANAAGKFYSAADTIDVTLSLNTVTDAGKIRVIALCATV